MLLEMGLSSLEVERLRGVEDEDAWVLKECDLGSAADSMASIWRFIAARLSSCALILSNVLIMALRRYCWNVNNVTKS